MTTICRRYSTMAEGMSYCESDDHNTKNYHIYEHMDLEVTKVSCLGRGMDAIPPIVSQ